MSAPVQIIVQAQTAEAAAAIKAFIAQSSAGLKTMQVATADLGKSAAETSAHIAGMTYYFRSGIDSIRFALADGGARAGFYAVDEGVRALVASGMKLTTLVPVLGVLGTAVGAGVLAWHEWNKAQDDAAEKAKELAAAWKELPGLLSQIADMQKTGLLGPGQAQDYIDYVTGQKKLYIDRLTGATTPNPATRLTTAEAGSLPFDVLSQGTPFNGGITVPNEQQTDPTKMLDYIKDTSTAGGAVAKEQLKALADLKDETQQLNEMALTGIAKQKAEVENRYQTEQDKIRQTIELVKAQLGNVRFASSPVVQAAQAALGQSQTAEDNELAGLDAKQQEDLVRQRAESEEAIKKQFADAWEMENKNIDDRITMEAAAAGKQREAYYREEYNQRIVLATMALQLGGISEQQYTDAVASATEKLTQGQERMNEQLQKELELRQRIAEQASSTQLKSIQNNPLLSPSEKDAQSVPILQQQIAQQQAAILAMTSQQGQLNSSSEAYLELQEKIGQAMGKQAEMQGELAKAQGSSSFIYQMQTYEAQWRNVTNLAQDFSGLLKGALDEGMSSVADNMTKVIMGTEKWNRALINIEMSTMSEIIDAIIKMGEEWIVQELLNLTIGESINATALATATASAAALKAIWAPAAVLSAIATDGVSLLAGAAALAISAFAEGGRPDVGKIALVGERGPEFFIPDTAGTIITAHQTAAMLQGRGDAGGFSQNVEGHRMNVHFWDSRPSAREYLNSSDGENHIIDIARKNRTKIGLGT